MLAQRLRVFPNPASCRILLEFRRLEIDSDVTRSLSIKEFMPEHSSSNHISADTFRSPLWACHVFRGTPDFKKHCTVEATVWDGYRDSQALATF